MERGRLAALDELLQLPTAGKKHTVFSYSKNFLLVGNDGYEKA
ncbi:MAG: hypothetical protein RIR79_2000 [Pseudomonadota bacterium]